MKKFFNAILIMILISLNLTACVFNSSPSSSENSNFDYSSPGGKNELNIVAGSEIKDLKPIFDEFSKKNNIKINIDYLGSLDIMNLLGNDPANIIYDAVWPANSMWLTIGDKNHILKHSEITSITPVTFGIEKSKAQELGFIDKEVKVQDIITAIEEGKLNFGMTSATQSNSGASAYIGFLQALDPSKDSNLTLEDLENPGLQKKIRTLLSGVNRASGSSGWLRDLYLKDENLNAMVNYEAMILSVNQEIEKGNNPANKEPLHMVYPVDGLTFSDSPLAFINKKDNPDNQDKEADFLKFQEYMLSDQVQEQIQDYGRRTAFNRITNPSVFKEEWGVDIKSTLSPINYPESESIMQALTLYQTSFKKPAYTIYMLDFSGSMFGRGYDELIEALSYIFIPENAQKYLLQGTSEDKTIAVAFSSDIISIMEESGGDLSQIHESLKNIEPNGGTKLYGALKETLENLKGQDLSDYNVSIVVLSDGKAGDSQERFLQYYNQIDSSIPIFTIATGGASEKELSSLSNATNGKYFDGENLVETFKDVKGYN